MHHVAFEFNELQTFWGLLKILIMLKKTGIKTLHTIPDSVNVVFYMLFIYIGITAAASYSKITLDSPSGMYVILCYITPHSKNKVNRIIQTKNIS